MVRLGANPATRLAATAPRPHTSDASACPRMSEFTVQQLLSTPVVAVRDVYCRGQCRHASTEECAKATYLVFPHRGVYVRHLSYEPAVA